MIQGCVYINFGCKHNMTEGMHSNWEKVVKHSSVILFANGLAELPLCKESAEQSAILRGTLK